MVTQFASRSPWTLSLATESYPHDYILIIESPKKILSDGPTLVAFGLAASSEWKTHFPGAQLPLSPAWMGIHISRSIVPHALREITR